MANVVELHMAGAVGVVTINNPPANALSFAVVRGIDAAVKQCMADTACKALVLTGAGRIFIAGANIREFNLVRPDDVPELHDLVKAIEDSTKPVVAAINGLALGGGLELAMGCHYRLISSNAQVGQPEVKLGFIPGAGGTQRLPRLAGVEAALQMITGGEPITAQEALALGIADHQVESIDHAIAFAETQAGEKLRRTGEQLEKIRGWDAEKFSSIRKKMQGGRGQDHLMSAVDCIEAATTIPFNQGLKFERVTFVRLRDSAEAKAMRYMFFAEREVMKIPDLPREISGATVKEAGVIGAGTMGGGIAMCFANAGIPVVVVDVSEEGLSSGLKRIREIYAGSVSRHRITQKVMDERMALITFKSDFSALCAVDFVVEAVFEDIDLKKTIFKNLDSVCKPTAILASNTSSLDINEIAAITQRPEKVIGMHFFSPANVMKLVENIRTRTASQETIATVMNLSKILNKIGVLVGVGEGFVGNRMMHVARRVAEFMVEEGAMPWQIDKVLYDYGFPMGVFAMSDLAGIDVGVAIRQSQRRSYPDRRHPVLMEKIFSLGRWGQKSGAGWYEYSGGYAVPAPVVESLVLQTSKDLGIKRRTFTDQEILRNYLAALINTGSQLLEDGLAIRGSDIDVIWHHGYGFPRYRGGPMFQADLLGVEHVLGTVNELHQKYGDWIKPSALLQKLVKFNKKLSEFKVHRARAPI